MKFRTALLTLAAFPLFAGAADLTGTWKAEFESQIGTQKYTYTLKQDGTNLTGKAASVINDEKRESDLKEGSVVGDKVAFLEALSFQGNDIAIHYTGTLVGGDLKLTREVGTFAKEEIVAHRQAAPPLAAAGQRGGRGGRGGFGGPIELGPDDKAAFPVPPEGFDKAREGIAHGELQMVEYESKSVGSRRKALVYTPPGYSTNQHYPVLYLLHGIGGDEEEWRKGGHPEIILDNLLAEKKVVPMIVVMPNGRAQPDDRPGPNAMATAPAFAKFEGDLLQDLIPFIQGKFSVTADRTSRALAGLSMGGGQSLNFGLGHLDTFAWIGGFSSAPNTKSPQELVPAANSAHAAEQLSLLYVSCGNKDGLIRISQGVHKYLLEQKVPHIWHVDDHAHDFAHWKNSLFHFSQLIFQPKKA